MKTEPQILSSPLISISDRTLVLGAVLSLLVVVPLFVMPIDPGQSSTLRVVGTVVSDGVVRRRHSRSLGWEQFVGQAPVHLRDILYTPRGVQAEVRLQNGEIATLPPDSLIQFDEVTLDNIRIALKEKEVSRFRLLPLPKASQREFLMDPESLAQQLEDLSVRLAAVLSRTLSLAAVREKPMRAMVPIVKNLRDFQVRLLRPAKAARFDLKATPWIDMRWTPIPMAGVSYELQVARNPIFSPLISYQTSKDSLKVQIRDVGPYYWRVNAIKGEESALSENASFVMYNRAVASVAVETVKTEGPSISGFMMELAQDAEFKTIVKTAVTPGAECPKQGLGPGNYFCRLRPISGGSEKIYQFKIP